MGFAAPAYDECAPARLAQEWYSRTKKDRAQCVACSGMNMATFLIDTSALVATANLLRSMGATRVYLFGSATKGGLRVDSDVDVAVTGLPSEVYFSAISKASNLLGRPVDLVDLDDPTPLVDYLLDSGELVRVG